MNDFFLIIFLSFFLIYTSRESSTGTVQWSKNVVISRSTGYERNPSSVAVELSSVHSRFRVGCKSPSALLTMPPSTFYFNQ